MEEAITFWLDNKISSGFKVAEVDNQILVLYRDKYYVIVGGAALMKGVRPLHYSKSSLPLIWKKAMKGILPPVVTAAVIPEDEILPETISSKKERTKMPKPDESAAEQVEPRPQVVKPQQAAPKHNSHAKAAVEAKPVRISQSVVVAHCPYCNHKHDLPIEKGKNGKPFFTACARCSAEFAVRFVPVTMYQAQVAAFK